MSGFGLDLRWIGYPRLVSADHERRSAVIDSPDAPVQNTFRPAKSSALSPTAANRLRPAQGQLQPCGVLEY